MVLKFDMNASELNVLGMLLLSVAAPFVALASILLARKGRYRAHRFVHNVLFSLCVCGVVALEVQIRIAGGSGSLVQGSPYINTAFFKGLLAAHVLGAVVTYLVWGYLIFSSNRKYQLTLPGSFSKLHRNLGIGVVIGLFYTAATAAIVYYLAFVAKS